MSGPLTILRKLQKVDILKSARLAMELTEEDAMEQQMEQLERGQDRYETRITNYETGRDTYSPSYAAYKGFAGPINLKDEGNYYEGFKLDVRGMIFKITSTDWKNDMLYDTYQALGLGPKAKAEWIKTLRPVFMNEIRGQLK